MKKTDSGLRLRSKEENKLSWEETYKAMACEKENWDDLDITIQDGLEYTEYIAVDQIRTISKQRLKTKIDQLSPSKAAQLRKLITDMYGE